jgi:NADH-quinone oxidoreductase subunit D
MCSGPVLRAAGVEHDLRKASPYSGYEEFEFKIPTEKAGDSYARYLIRMQEMMESLSILEQAMKKLKPGPVLADNRKVALPPRKELVVSMEAVIHHFKLISEGIRPPPGRIYNAVESARGELGMFLISDGTNKPYHLRVRSPSFSALQTLGPFLPGHLLSDVVVAIASLDPILGDVDR